LCLGDSVTAMTYRVYPATAQRLATSVNLARPLEFRNAAVPGYTTEQGIRWFDRLKGWQPDVVLLCFGWNDQFRALNIPDRELGYANMASGFLHRAFGRLRLYQMVAAPVEARLLRGADHPTNDTATSTALEQPRVSLEQFEQNLRTLVQQARSTGALPVLLTQPENLGEASERNLERRNLVSQETGTAIEVHKRYNAITRRVAIETHAPLVDLEEEFLRRKRENFFEPDGIHMTGRGHNHVSRLILALLREEGRITTPEYDAIARAERHDTSAPDKPRAAWSVVPPHVDAYTTDTLNIGVVAHNVGNTRWLRDHVLPKFGTRTDVPYGSVSVIGRWRTVNSPGRIAASAPLPSDILPGETTSVTLTLAAPPKPGDYELEIGLRADEIGELKKFGAETTTFTVTTRP
jgi:lysophospholipase L1-like esterase